MRALLVLLGVFIALLSPARAVDMVSSFAPVIRTPGSVRSLVWHAPSGLIYASVVGDKLNGVMLASSLVRFNAAGDWDSSYAPAVDSQINCMSVQADGKIILAGNFTSIAGHTTFRVARLLSSGEVDTSFVVPNAAIPATPQTLAVASDGTIYVGSSRTPLPTWNGSTYTFAPLRLITKVSPAGVVDSQFGPNFAPPPSSIYTSSTTGITALIVTPAGDLVAGGNFTQINGAPQNYIAKIAPNGALDSSYNPLLSQASSTTGPQTTPAAYALVVDSLNRVYVGGSFNRVNGVSSSALIRLTTAGAKDPAFNAVFYNSIPGFVRASSFPPVSTLFLDSAGALIVIGSFEGFGGQARANIARLLVTGDLDASFTSTFSNNDKVVQLPDDSFVFGRTSKVIVANIVQGALQKTVSSGKLNNTFDPDLRDRGAPDSITVRPGNGIILSGRLVLEINGVERNSITALDTNGAIDSSFNPALSPAATAGLSLMLPDGRVLISGSFTEVGGLSRPRLALVDAAGLPITNFDLGTGPSSTISALRLLPSGKVFLGGSFTSINGEVAQNIAIIDLNALNVTGSIAVEEILEARYGTAGASNDVRTIVANALVDGAVSLAINTTTMGGDPAPGQTKFLSLRIRTNRGERTARIGNSTTLRLPNIAWDSGLVDRGFRPKNTENLSISDVAPQKDGRIIILGSFSSFAGTVVDDLARLSPDGSIDGAFNPLADFYASSVRTVRVDSDGLIYIGGLSLKPLNSSDARGMFRLLPDGSVDASFSAPSDFTWIDKIELLPDGSIFCGGPFSVPGASRNYIARLSHDGSLDTRFDPADVISFWPNSLTLEAPNKVWSTSALTSSINGLNRDGIYCFELTTPIVPLAQINPVSVDTTEGATIRLNVANASAGETYNWLRGGVLIPNASGRSLVIPNAQPTDAGIYSFTATNTAGTTTSSSSIVVNELTLNSWLSSHGLTPSQADDDADNDGTSNRAEYIARTDPLSRDSVFAAKAEIISGGLRLRWPTYPGRNYTVETSTDLIHWETAVEAVLGNGSEATGNVTFDSQFPRQFWRVNVARP